MNEIDLYEQRERHHREILECLTEQALDIHWLKQLFDRMSTNKNYLSVTVVSD